MDCKISVVLKDSDFQMPRYIKRVKPEADTDSGLRIYLGCEYTHNPEMIILGDVEGYLRDFGLYELVHDIPIGYRVDFQANIKDFPHISYKRNTLKFSPMGLLTLSDNQRSLQGMVLLVPEKDLYGIPFWGMTLEEKESIEWKDRKLIQKMSAYF